MPAPTLRSLAINVYNQLHGVDPLRVIQRHVNIRRFRRRVRKIKRYHRVYCDYCELVEFDCRIFQMSMTWRGLAQFFNRLELTQGDLSHEFVRDQMVAVEQRLTMQRFVRGLHRLVRRARYAADCRRVASVFAIDSQWTWRELSRDRVHLLSEAYGDVCLFPDHMVRDLVIATRG